MAPLRPFLSLLDNLVDHLLKPTKRYISAIPFEVAQSLRYLRVVTLSGFALLSTALIIIILQMVEVNEDIRETEELARRQISEVRGLFSRAKHLADLAKRALETEEVSLDTPEAAEGLLKKVLLSEEKQVSGLSILKENDESRDYQRLDPSLDDDAWNSVRWEALRHEMSASSGATQDVTLFLGLERYYRTKEEFNSGAQLAGTFVLVRRWCTAEGPWMAVAALIPLHRVLKLLRTAPENYLDGNYDYVIDNDGYLMVHPNKYHIRGFDSKGKKMPAATEEEEIGRFPINTRDSDWITGDDVLNKAYSSMFRSDPRSVVYRNLKKQDRLTRFELIDLAGVGIDGRRIGIVVGRGLRPREAFVARLLLKEANGLTSALWLVASAYSALLAGWLYVISKLHWIHRDLLAWGVFVKPEIARRMSLYPIPFNKNHEHIFSDTVGVMISVDLSRLKDAQINKLLESLNKISLKLREDGWVTNHWSLRSIVACRPLKESEEDGKPLQIWSPTAVVNYLRQLDVFEIGGLAEKTAAYRLAYAIGDLRLRSSRTGRMRKAVVWIHGSCVTKTLALEERVDSVDVESGTLFFTCDDLTTAGLQVVGDGIGDSFEDIRKISL